MEPISGEQNVHSIHNQLNGLSVKSSSNIPYNLATPLDNNGNLDAVSDLTKLARNSSPDIREDVIEKAKKLLANPNWLSDDNLLSLSSKLLQDEDFDS
jgi:lipid-binding SYLF domain-containing protein